MSLSGSIVLPPSSSATHRELDSPRTRTRVVLVASSDASLRERLRMVLTGLRWQVIEAQGGAGAWAASESRELEALLIDPWLPDLDIAEFLAEFQRERPAVTLMLTDGAPVPQSPRSAYQQELLYALRTCQGTDTAVWNASYSMGEERDLAALPALAIPALAPAIPAHVPGTDLGAGSEYGTQTAAVAAREGGNGTLSVASSTTPVAWNAVSAAARADSGKTAVPSRPARARRETAAVEPIPELIGSSPAMLEVSRRIRLVADRTTPVLIEGPTGSGKELVAEALHRLSSRSRNPFVAINCAAIPEALLEAELFGHTRGAFTGAVHGRTGRIESADGGTLFLDEIGEMPLALQSKLLRFVESGELQRIGDNETLKVDVRILAATHQPLAEHAVHGNFRPDLYYRLAVFLIRTPALSEHLEDLSRLVMHFLEQMGKSAPVKRLDASAMATLEAHGWPGNVRELQHVLERAAILAGDEPVIGAEEIDFGLSPVH